MPVQIPGSAIKLSRCKREAWVDVDELNPGLILVVPSAVRYGNGSLNEPAVILGMVNILYMVAVVRYLL